MKLHYRVVGAAWRLMSKHLGSTWFRLHGAAIGDGCVLYGLPIIELANGCDISIGRRAVLCSKARFTALGVARPVIIRAMSAGAVIRIGDNVGLSGTTLCANKEITVGRDCLFGADVVICDTDFHPVNPEGRRHSNEGIVSAPVSIGHNVFLGARSIVLKGVSVGDNSVIGAGSVVVSNIPANVIAAGNPCRVIRQLASVETRC